MLLQCLFAFGAIITFSVIIEAPRKCLLVNGILGLAGWAIYLYTEPVSYTHLHLQHYSGRRLLTMKLSKNIQNM